MDKRYEGKRIGGLCVVMVTETDGSRRKLRLRLDLFNHSPTGFEWGYEGSGPAQLALALLADALGDDDRAIELHQTFKRSVIAHLPRDDGWVLGASDVRNLCQGVQS